MATSTCVDLHPGMRRVGIMLMNLSACEVRIPPKTEIGNVQTAEIVPNMKALTQACAVFIQRSKMDCNMSASLPTQIPNI